MKKQEIEMPVRQRSWKRRALRYGGVDELLRQKEERKQARFFAAEHERLLALESENETNANASQEPVNQSHHLSQESPHQSETQGSFHHYPPHRRHSDGDEPLPGPANHFRHPSHTNWHPQRRGNMQPRHGPNYYLHGPPPPPSPDMNWSHENHYSTYYDRDQYRGEDYRPPLGRRHSEHSMPFREPLPPPYPSSHMPPPQRERCDSVIPFCDIKRENSDYSVVDPSEPKWSDYGYYSTSTNDCSSEPASSYMSSQETVAFPPPDETVIKMEPFEEKYQPTEYERSLEQS